MAINAMTTFANREVYNMILCDFNSGKPVLNIDWANATSNDITGEEVYAYGGWGHPKRVTFYGEKGGTITIETQMQSYQLYSIMTGAAIEKTARFLEREVVTATTAGTLTVKSAPIEGTVNVFADGDDCGTPLEGVTSAETTISGESIEQDQTYIVYYMKEYTTGVTRISITDTTIPKAVIIYGDTVSRTEDDQIVSQRLVAYKATPQQNVSWSYSNSGDPTSLSITFDLLVNSDGQMLDLLTIEDDAE